jgi:cytochrome b pre-mRNA-processing protein 3
MPGWFSNKTAAKSAAEALYGKIVAAARSPMFYRDWGVPDTVEGRFEMIAHHMALVLGRLSAEGDSGQNIARALTEACIADLDDNMREIGIGDIVVPRKVKRAAAALYDRHRDILGAIANDDRAALDKIVSRDVGNLPGVTSFNAHAFSGYLLESMRALSDIPSSRLLNGEVLFQAPATS